MIDINKKYRTRAGAEVRIYALDGGGNYPVHGAFKSHTGWVVRHWPQDGIQSVFGGSDDLIEVKPRVQRTVWLNVYAREDRPSTKKQADEHAFDTRLACVKVEIDVEEGHGL
jgi:hypothetical protein